MEHLAFVGILGIVLGALAVGLWWLTARAAGLRNGVPGAGLRRWAAHLPAAVFAITAGMMLVEMAGDPTAGNLWPIAVAGMVMLWLIYAGVLRIVAGLADRLAGTATRS